MIRAAVLCAYGRAAPPPELQMAWQADRWHALPNGGGLIDQPAGLLDCMAATSEAFELMRDYRALKPAQVGAWQHANPTAWKKVQRWLKFLK